MLKIKKIEAADYLINNFGFKFVASELDGSVYIDAPERISQTKARKLISAVIKLHITKLDIVKAQRKYDAVKAYIFELLK